MAAPKRLQAVPDGAVAPVKAGKTVTQAAAAGTTRELLVAMRDRVALDVESPSTPARDLAALTRRLLEITREIELIDAKEAEDADGGAATPDDEWEAV